MNYQVFVSAAQDCKFAYTLFEKLLLRGYLATYGCCDFTDSADAYERKIAGCRDVIFLLSAEALMRADRPDDLFGYSAQLATKYGCNMVVLVTDGVTAPLCLPDVLEPLGAYPHPLPDGPLSRSNLDRSMDIICSKLSAEPMAPQMYRRAGREQISLRTPLLNPYRPAAGYNPVILRFRAFVERNILNAAPFSRDDSQVSACISEKFGEWNRKNGNLLDAVHEKARALKSFVAESGTMDSFYYSSAVFFAGGHLQMMPSYFKTTYPLACMEAFYYCVDWPEGQETELTAAFSEQTYQIFQKVIPDPFAVFNALLTVTNASAERRQLVEKYTLMLFDYMMHLAALLVNTVRDPQYFVKVNQQMVCYYAYVKKLGLYLPEDMQMFMAQNFK